MSDEIDTTSEVARVLIDHTRIDGIHGDCLCKHVVPLGHSFAAHQAAMLAEAGLLRDHVTIDALNQRCQILVDEGDRLRAQIATQEPAGGTQGGSGDSRALGERLRALGTGQTRTLRKVLRAMADEADRLEVVSNGARIKVQLDRVVALADEWASSPAVGSSSAEQWEFDTLRNAARDLRDVLAQEVP